MTAEDPDTGVWSLITYSLAVSPFLTQELYLSTKEMLQKSCIRPVTDLFLCIARSAAQSRTPYSWGESYLLKRDQNRHAVKSCPERIHDLDVYVSLMFQKKSTYFSIDPVHGTLVLVDTLNYSKRRAFQFDIIATVSKPNIFLFPYLLAIIRRIIIINTCGVLSI